MAILVAVEEAIGTHHLDLFLKSGGTRPMAEAIARLVGYAAAARNLSFMSGHWGRHLPGLDAEREPADAGLAEEIEVGRAHNSNHVDFLFNIAGLNGGGSFVNDPVDQWDYTFDVCWGGVYRCCRAFLPMILRSSAEIGRAHV